MPIKATIRKLTPKELEAVKERKESRETNPVKEEKIK